MGSRNMVRRYLLAPELPAGARTSELVEARPLQTVHPTAPRGRLGPLCRVGPRNPRPGLHWQRDVGAGVRPAAAAPASVRAAPGRRGLGMGPSGRPRITGRGRSGRGVGRGRGAFVAWGRCHLATPTAASRVASGDPAGPEGWSEGVCDMGQPAQPTGVYEQDLAVFIAFDEAEEAALWDKAAWVRAMTARYGRETARLLARDTGHSAYYVRCLIATAEAFPDPADRAADLSFSHHRIAAFTDDPAAWIDRAAAEQWNVADLREAIRAARDPVAADAAAEQAQARLERAVERFNRLYAATAGVRAVLQWGPGSGVGPERDVKGVSRSRRDYPSVWRRCTVVPRRQSHGQCADRERTRYGPGGCC